MPRWCWHGPNCMGLMQLAYWMHYHAYMTAATRHDCMHDCKDTRQTAVTKSAWGILCSTQAEQMEHAGYARGYVQCNEHVHNLGLCQINVMNKLTLLLIALQGHATRRLPSLTCPWKNGPWKLVPGTVFCENWFPRDHFSIEECYMDHIFQWNLFPCVILIQDWNSMEIWLRD